MKEINFVFAIGERCTSFNFLRKNKITTFPGPFDKLFIDIETCFELINTNFENFMTDIVSYNHKYSKLFFKKNIETISSFFDNLYEEENGDIKSLRYMKYDYCKEKILINQNFLPKIYTSSDIYNWDRVCIFRHDSITKKNIRNTMNKRCERMIKVLNNHNSLLVNMTKIISNPVNETTRLLNLINKYDIKHEIFIIMFTTCEVDLGLFNYNNVNIYRILVESFEEQNKKYGLDNKISEEVGKDIIRVINELYCFVEKEI